MTLMGPGEDQSVLQLDEQKAFQKLITKYDSRPKAQPSMGDPISLLILLLMDLECYLKFLAGVGGGAVGGRWGGGHVSTDNKE